MGHETIWSRAVPMPFARGRTDRVAGMDLDGLPAARLDEPDAFGDVHGLTDRMRMPGVTSARREANDADADPGWLLAPDQDVVPGVADERLGRGLHSRLLRLDLHGGLLSSDRSHPHERLDRPALVHRRIGVGDMVEVGLEVEDAAGVDVPGEDFLEELGQVPADRGH